MRWCTLAVWLVGCLGGPGDPPNAQSFEASPDTITEGEESVLTLTVTDPQGVQDVVGVTIVDDETDMTLVQVDASPDENGTYSTTVSWDDFAALGALEFTGSQTRSLTATFTDQAGNTSGPVTTDVDLRCAGDGGLATQNYCFNPLEIEAVATSTCSSLCADAGFRCDNIIAAEVFEEVGRLTFAVTQDGKRYEFDLPIAACNIQGDQVPFEIDGTSFNLDSESEPDFTCHCRPPEG